MQVGDRQITEQDLYPLLAQYQFLPRLAREILVDKAIAGLECSPAEKEKALQFFYQRNQLANDEQRLAWLRQSGMTQEQLECFVVRELKLERFKQQNFEEQIEGHFLASKDKLDRIVYSLIRTQEAGIAQELYFRIQEEEEDFAELARQFSQGGEAETGGLIGPVELNIPHPRIVQILKTTPSGQISAPTKIGDWWVLLRLEKYLASQLDDSMRQRLLGDLFQRWLTNQLEKEVQFFPPQSSAVASAAVESPWDAPPSL